MALPRTATAAGITAGIAAAGLAWGLAEAAMFTVRRVTLPILPPGGEPLKVLHVSDIHLTTRQHFKLDFIRRLERLRPDLIVNTGDNIADPEAVFPLMAAWNRLRFVPGVFVFGSNDYYAPKVANPLRYLTHGRSRSASPDSPTLPTEELRGAFEKVGWVDLNHHRATLEVADYRLGFRGTDDAHLGRDNYALVAGPDSDVDLSIGVTHAPYRGVLDAMTEDGLDLIFAGHTHGGQVCLPGYGALTSNSDLPTRQAQGLSIYRHALAASHLHVSNGVGTSPYAPVRFACRPSVTLVTLTTLDVA
ncbi:MAG: metallophosphoesterase [Arachnia sp.]